MGLTADGDTRGCARRPFDRSVVGPAVRRDSQARACLAAGGETATAWLENTRHRVLIAPLVPGQSLLTSMAGRPRHARAVQFPEVRRELPTLVGHRPFPLKICCIRFLLFPFKRLVYLHIHFRLRILDIKEKYLLEYLQQYLKLKYDTKNYSNSTSFYKIWSKFYRAFSQVTQIYYTAVICPII